MDSEKIKNRIKSLKEESKVHFGIMTPQHMIEHLTITMKMSSARIKLPDFEPNEKQLAQKDLLLNTSLDFPRGIRAPGSTGELPDLKMQNLEIAKEKFITSIEEFNSFFEDNPEAQTIHPRFGKLNYSEWLQFHPKHFAHHLGQFGISFD